MSVEVMSWKFARERKAAFVRGREATRSAFGRML